MASLAAAIATATQVVFAVDLAARGYSYVSNWWAGETKEQRPEGKEQPAETANATCTEVTDGNEHRNRTFWERLYKNKSATRRSPVMLYGMCLEDFEAMLAAPRLKPAADRTLPKLEQPNDRDAFVKSLLQKKKELRKI